MNKDLSKVKSKEMDESFIATLESILQICDRMNSGNVSHNVATIKCKCREMLSFYKKYHEDEMEILMKIWKLATDATLKSIDENVDVVNSEEELIKYIDKHIFNITES